MRSRREQLNSAGANITEPRINASGQISKTKNSAGVGSANSNKKAPPPSAGVSSSRHHQLTDREAFWLELDNIGFADLQTAVDNALTVLNGWDEAVVVQDKEKKDKKKPNANEPAEPKSKSCGLDLIRWITI